uniref:Protein transport protein Sec31A n=1 Tax=Electrophorus electricus TaxID=8005 RepID=A0A4W4E344_ELEEL
MKIKEINRTAIQTWSPAQHHPIYLAAGTSAQQLDATFSTNASLEIFELDLAEPTLAMKSCGAFTSLHRYHKLVWGPHGFHEHGLPSGVLIAGGETGNIILYDPSKIIAGDSDVVISQSNKHTGPVRALDVNSFQTNLVVSGGNESEIYIWDLNSFNSPMTPGPKSQPLEDISCVAWNCQVQHILASASPSGRASIWDLRKNELIIKVSDHSNRMHCSGLAWNPEVATQLVLASEDDHMPVIQMWDLRFATSPLKVLENHTRGVLAIAWSLADPELLLSCGKDNRILCWNPSTAEVLYELPTSSQWCFDIQWCPRNPAILSAASFDGRIGIYSIMGGSDDTVCSAQADQISSSFANMDPFGTGQTLPPLQLPQAAGTAGKITPLKKPPKWIRRPVGASFAFGGKLVSLENVKPAAQQSQQALAHVVHISQVIIETEFLHRSNQLQAMLSSGGFVTFCQAKIEAAPNEFEKTVWAFLKVNFEDDARGKYLDLLGYKKEELALKVILMDVLLTSIIHNFLWCSVSSSNLAGWLMDHILSSDCGLSVFFLPDLFDAADIDGLITQALLVGDFEAAVNLCLYDNRMADSIILAIAGGPKLLEKTQKKYFTKTQNKISKLITAVVMKEWIDILETCDLQNWKEALAAVMTYAKPEEFSSLCGLLGSRLEAAEESSLQAQACLCYICAGSMEQLVLCLSKAQDSSNPLLLQDLVEKVVVLQKAVEKTQGGVAPTVGTLLAEKMSQYANLLASQGSLHTAMSYLPTNTTQASPIHFYFTVIMHININVGFNKSFYPQVQPFTPGAGGPTIYQPFQYFSSTDPSIPHPPSSSAAVPFYTHQFMHPTCSQPASSVFSGPPHLPAGLSTSSAPPLSSSSSSFSPPSFSSGVSFQYGGPGSPIAYFPPSPTGASGTQAEHPLIPASQRTGLHHSVLPIPENYTPPAPITAPIMAPLGDPQQTAGMQPPQPQPQQPTGVPSPFTPIQQQPLGLTVRNPTIPTMTMEGAPGAPTGEVVQPMQSLPAEKIMKKPIPDEHLILKTTFEGLIQKCLAAASDPQTKRKLDDANKRLESLYDKLREQTLSPFIVGGLHSLARSIESHAYADGLNIHTHIVSNSNFSETSAFMPVLKVVLTQANKLGI